MHNTSVKLKSGEELCGPIWLWRPTEGFFTLAGEEPDRKIYLRDVEYAVTKDERTSINHTSDQDELERAKENGWDGT